MQWYCLQTLISKETEGVARHAGGFTPQYRTTAAFPAVPRRAEHRHSTEAYLPLKGAVMGTAGGTAGTRPTHRHHAVIVFDQLHRCTGLLHEGRFEHERLRT